MATRLCRPLSDAPPHVCPAPHIESTHLGHDHLFHAPAEGAERGTRIVLVITLVTMVVEIVAGWLSGSMALLADGWHMSSHAVAIGLGVVAYATARRYARDPALRSAPGRSRSWAGSPARCC